MTTETPMPGISNERLAEMIGQNTPCVPATGVDAIKMARELQARRALSPGVVPVVSVKTMRKTDNTADYFVSIAVGEREVTPHFFTERYKAEYHVALYDWLLNGGEEPDVMAFGPDEWPARIMSDAAASDHIGGTNEMVRHKKRGGTYDVITRAGKVQTDTPLPDYAEVVVYRAHEDGTIWVRPVSEFDDGRFEPVEKAHSGQGEV